MFVSGIYYFQDECVLILNFLWFPKHRYIDILEYMSGCHILAIYLVKFSAALCCEQHCWNFLEM